jgi:hypothetical protein
LSIAFDFLFEFEKCSPICICVLLIMLWNIACFVKNWTKGKISEKKNKRNT